VEFEFYTDQYVALSNINISEYILEYNMHNVANSKGKAIPLQVWTGPEGSKRMMLPHFKKINTYRW
jgi:hypothetical protein